MSTNGPAAGNGELTPIKMKIARLFPEALNLFGDAGNLAALSRRLLWRGIDCELREISLSGEIDFMEFDIILLGGGGDQALLCAADRLCRHRDDFCAYAKSGGVVLAVCGGFPLLGKTLAIGGRETEGLGLLEIHTTDSESKNITGRLSGDVVLDCPLIHEKIVGFENHSSRTYIGPLAPLGRVLHGHGSNGEDGAEGVIYKHVIGTYLHGPLLPKNPQLCDYLLEKALLRKGWDGELTPLDDTTETAANHLIVNRYLKEE